jgi:hypothetical protein
MNAKFLFASALAAMLAMAGFASAQTYDQSYAQQQSTSSSYLPETGAPSTFGSGANSFSTTEAGSTLEGVGAALAGAGQYNLNTAIGARHLEEARAKYIRNYRDAIDARYAIKRAHDTYMAEKYAQDKMTPELLSRVIKAKLPDRLTAAEYNPRTGDLDWPDVLLAPEFAADRRAVAQAFAQRRPEDVGQTSIFYREVSLRTQRMHNNMLAKIDRLSTADSVAARKFLKSLEYEARQLPSAVSGLAMIDR